MYTFQHLDSFAYDAKGCCLVTHFGRTMDGKSIAVNIVHKPFFYIKSENIDIARIKRMSELTNDFFVERKT